MKNFELENLISLSRRFFSILNWMIFEGKWVAFACTLGLLVLWVTVYVLRQELKARRTSRR